MTPVAPAPEPHIGEYPPERTYVREAIAAALGLHVLFVIVVVLLALVFHIKSLRELMAGAIEQSGPAPEEKIEVTLIKLPPPPPVDHPEFIRQILIPKIVPVVVPPKPKPKPKPEPPKPHPIAAKPRYTAPAAAGRGESQSITHLVVGNSGFPHPGYPVRARLMHMTGTVVVSVEFDSGGGVESAQVSSSSGSGILDEATTSFIRENWHNASFAGKTEAVPIQYTLDSE